MLEAISNDPIITPFIVESSLWSCDCEIPDMHIYSNTVFDDDVGINGNVFVHAPATLTITSTIQFGKSKHIIVERGAKLHVDGGTLTKCPDAADWGGIRVEGNSAEEQPDAFGSPVGGKAGIVLMTNNAHVEHARTAMSTSRWKQVWNSAYWGGMIYCEHTTFYNNGRVAEILKYDETNQIKFFNCTMDGGDVGYAGTTIWDTDGVTFNRCRFYNMSSQGISTSDAGAIVKDGNDFIGNNRGIVSRASFPFAANMFIGEEGIEPNYFLDNIVHIESEASNKFDGLRIINNEFFESNSALRLNGPSLYVFRENTVDQTIVGINSFATGSLQNNQHSLVRDNTFGGLVGLNVRGENRELQFLCNGFTSIVFDFRLTPRNGALGEVRNKQGNNGNAADNCFTNPGQVIDILTTGQTTAFDYYVNNASHDCTFPVNQGNYTLQDAEGGDCPDWNFHDDPTEEDFINIQGEINTIINNGGQPEGLLADLLLEKEHILLSLLKTRIEADDIVGALNLLDTEGTVMSHLMKYGIQVDAGLYIDAQNTLSAMPNNVPEMPTFKQIQAINLDRLQTGLTYQLSESDSLFLENISISDMGVKPYARTVLYLLTGREFFDEFVLEEEVSLPNEMSNTPQLAYQSNKEVFTVFPNPAKDQFTIWLSKNIEAKRIRITDAVGKVVKKVDMNAKTGPFEIKTIGWEKGIYIVQVLGTDNKAVHTAKLFINQ